MSGNETSNTLVQGCLNPHTDSANFNHVYVGCTGFTITENKSETQPNTTVPNTTVPNTGIFDNLICCYYFQKRALERMIKRTLTDRYVEVTLPSLPWLEMCDISIEKYTTLQLESENERQKSKIIDLKNLFDNIDEQKQNRILIESQPGFGKTTLAHKIVSDWSKGSQYLQHFKFAILIVLRGYMASSLKQELKDVLGFENYSDRAFWNVINTDKTLLIFDGLDEISGPIRHDIHAIHDNKTEYKMTIVTTCRVGLSDLNRRDVQSTNRGVFRKKNIWSKKITILGINERNQSEFIEKFVDANDKDILMPRLANIIDTRKEMFNSPLLLILLVYVTSENHDIEIESDTDLYKALVDCIIRRSVHKINSELPCDDFTLFASRYNVPIFDDYKKQFVRFGEICLDRILKEDLQFASNTENEAIHQLGFLLKHVTKKLFGTIIRYEGFHLSILEFAAAVCIAHYFATNDNRFRLEDTDKLFEIIRYKELSSMVLPFLCDLLGIGITHLIEDLSRHYLFFWLSEKMALFLVRKCLMTNIAGEHFVKIIPRQITVNTFRSIAAFNDQNLAKLLVLELDDVQDLREICHPTHLRGLVCNGIDDKFGDVEELVDIARNITCESLTFTMKNDLPFENMANGFKIFRFVSSGCKNLYFRNRYLNRCTDFEKYTSLISGILVGEKLNKVIIEFGKIKKEVIAKMIECNHIENLVLIDDNFTHSPKSLAATVSHLATTIKCINSLFVLCPEFCVGWDSFTKIREECLNESNYVCTRSLTDSDVLNHNALAISPLKPIWLYCSCYKLDTLHYWNWDMIVELTLTGITRLSHIADFSKFKRLKILTLIIRYECELGEANVENIIGSIKSLNLTRLTMKWYSSDHCFYGSIIDGVLKLLRNKAIFCSESIRFEVTLNDVHSESFNFKTIKVALLSCSKIIFCIASNNWSDLRTYIFNHMNDLFFYNIKYSYTVYPIDNNPLRVGPLGFVCNSHGQHMLELTLS